MKALGLLSGGLDSTLAMKLILDQGIEVFAVKYSSPFCQCDQGGACQAAEVAGKLDIPLKIIQKGESYLEIVRNPKYGHGSGINPCIDCRIFMFKNAVQYAEEIGASFIFTGEVLGQRPMSQHLRAMQIIEKESGLAGKLVRPLCARLLPETEAEKNGWLDREKLLGFQGRTRKPQIALADDLGITGYACPAGGCLLTDKNYARKMRDLFVHSDTVTMRDAQLLKIGRHFRIGGCKIIAGRNERDNTLLAAMIDERDYRFEVPEIGSPLVLLRMNGSDEPPVQIAAEITAAYSDAESGPVGVSAKRDGCEKTIEVELKDKAQFSGYFI